MVPTARLLSIWDEHWRASLSVSPGGITTSHRIAWAVNTDQGAVIAASSIAIMAVGGGAIGLYGAGIATEKRVGWHA